MSRDFKYADGSQLQVQDPSSGGKHNVGVAYRNLSTTDYQKTFANYPGAILSQIRSSSLDVKVQESIFYRILGAS